MPVYAQPVGSNPLAPVAVSGTPTYFYGSFPQDTQDTIMAITNVALTTNVATVTVLIRGGNIPAVGNTITIQNCSNSVFNVTAAVITGVSITAATGAGTITFALTHANVVSAAASGFAIVPIAEVPETLAANQSTAIYVPSQEPLDYGVRSITVATTFPTLQATTGAATVTLYTAMKNDPIAPGATGSEWTSMGVVAAAAGGTQSAGPLQTFNTPAGRFFCLVVSGVTGTNTIVAKMIS